jgi:hypothetical protein
MGTRWPMSISRISRDGALPHNEARRIPVNSAKLLDLLPRT